MKIRYSGFNSLVVADDFVPLHIIVERPTEYFKLITAVQDSYVDRISEDFLLFNEKGKMKDVCFIQSPFELNVNSPSLFKAFAKLMAKQPCFASLSTESMNLQTQLMDLINRASSMLPLTVYTQECVDWIKLFQAFGVQLEGGDTLVDRIIHYADLQSYLGLSNTFIFAGFKSFLEEEELLEIYETFRQREFRLILLGQHVAPRLANEQIFILDRDLCEISDIL